MLSILETLKKQSWTLVDLRQSKLLSEEVLQSMRQYAEHNFKAGKFREAQIGREQARPQDRHVRSDSTFWFEHENPSQELQPLADFLQQLRQELNRQLYLGINNMEFHFARYGHGNHYDAHFDQFQSTNGLQGERLITLVLYLNPNWSAQNGGNLCIYSDDQCSMTQKIAPEWGKMILFDSKTIFHGVEECAAERYSFTGWFRRDQVNPFKL